VTEMRYVSLDTLSAVRINYANSRWHELTPRKNTSHESYKQ